MSDGNGPLKRSRWIGGTGLLAAASLALTGCMAEDGGGSAAGGEGVEAGATKEEYIEAFADIEPIELTTQLPGSPGGSGALHIEAYAEALEEWSGGKLTMEIAYGNAIVDPAQAPEALADGRLDFDYVYPLYDPSRYPANGALASASHLGEHDPVAGTLQGIAGFLESSMATPEIMEEMEADGVKMLIPFGPTSSNGLLCTEPLSEAADLEGAQVRVSGSAHAQQVEALGMSPVSLAYSELYQALQRGTIDCAMNATWTAMPLGIVPIAHNYTIDVEVGFARTPFGLGFGLAEWESLPLVAQQLIYDRLDVYIETMLVESIWQDMAAGADVIAEEGGTISGFGDEVAESLTEVNEQLLDEVRASEALDGEAFVSDTSAALDKWRGVVVDELGYPEIDHDEFLDWYSEGVDLGPYMDLLREDVLSQHRPE